MGFQKRNLSCALVIFGVVHPWVGQIRLNRDVFKDEIRVDLSGTDETGDAAPLSEATGPRPTLVSCLTASGPLARMP